MIAVHVIISGRVQGVWYRGWAQENALSLGLNGWVRNRLDGTVEAVFQGREEEVKSMLILCESGPISARVDHVKETPFEGPLPQGFHRKATI